MTRSFSVWETAEGEVTRFGTVYITIFALLISVGAVARDFGSIAVPSAMAQQGSGTVLSW